MITGSNIFGLLGFLDLGFDVGLVGCCLEELASVVRDGAIFGLVFPSVFSDFLGFSLSCSGSSDLSWSSSKPESCSLSASSSSSSDSSPLR